MGTELVGMEGKRAWVGAYLLVHVGEMMGEERCFEWSRRLIVSISSLTTT